MAWAATVAAKLREGTQMKSAGHNAGDNRTASGHTRPNNATSDEQWVLQVKGWIMAKTKCGQWSNKIHVAHRWHLQTKTVCACGLHLAKRPIRIFDELEDIPKGKAVCTNCFDRLHGTWWAKLAQERPDILPRGRKRLRDVS